MAFHHSPSIRRRGVLSLRLLALVAILVSVATTSSGPAQAGTTSYSLSAGQEQFWQGGYAEYAQVYDASKCGDLGPCWEYQLHVTEPGRRLRVALTLAFGDPSYVRWWSDHLDYNNNIFSQDSVFTMELYDPQGTLVEGEETTSGYAREVFVENPAVGTWTVRVTPKLVQKLGFRMRAKLETAPQGPGQQQVLSPNLRIIPPFEVNFNTPTYTYGPSMPNDGNAPSCMVEELVEAEEEGDGRPRHCLRFSAGIENVGPGPLLLMATCNDYPWLRHPECKDPEGELEEGTVQMYQRRLVQQPDGSKTCCVEEPVGSAGIAEYHDFHGHFHYEDVYVYDLYKVTNTGWTPRSGVEPTLEFVNTSNKRGFWPADEYMAKWTEFYQAARDGEPNATLYLSTGWGDVYEHNRGGNFIGFPVDERGHPQPGYYVIRSTVDVDKQIIEANEDDNVSYTFIKVGGRKSSTEVMLLERGYGADPWDPNKAVLELTP